DEPSGAQERQCRIANAAVQRRMTLRGQRRSEEVQGVGGEGRLPMERMLPLLKPLLMLTLLLIFLKIDVLDLLEKVRDYRLMVFISVIFLVITPLVLYGFGLLFSQELAIGILLLAAMPAGTSAPVLVDMLKGNYALGMSITLLTSMLAPFTLPLLFYFLIDSSIEINQWSLFWDAASMIFIPMLLSVVIKPMFPRYIKRVMPAFTAINIIILFLILVTSFGSQRALILSAPLTYLGDALVIVLIFILLHLIGYLMSYKMEKKDRIALIVESAYMNNGLAIVLAANFFSPYVLILMVLAEIPWSLLLIPLRWVLKRAQWV
ncbi:MAG: bile acid:sodium symporter, partial [Bacteroidota bacterium]